MKKFKKLGAKVILFLVGFIAFLALLAEASACDDKNRSASVRRHFQTMHPCPSTGQKTGSCPGYIVDHVVALCAGGLDDTSNMQWQTVTDAAAKDKVECKKKPVKK